MKYLEEMEASSTHWAVKWRDEFDHLERTALVATKDIAKQVAELVSRGRYERDKAVAEERQGSFIPYLMRSETGGKEIVYAEYILSPAWKAKADEAKKRVNSRCQVCNSPDKIQAHHRTYERLGYERPEDITVLCDECHERHHVATKANRA